MFVGIRVPKVGISKGNKPITYQDGHSVVDALNHAQQSQYPFRHWLLQNVLPQDVCEELITISPQPKQIASQIDGERASHNPYRIFINKDWRRTSPVMDRFAAQLDSDEGKEAFGDVCHTSLKNMRLRVELCFDGEGFWLKRHRDIGAKKLTLIVSLNENARGEALGTDLFNAQGEHIKRASSRFNDGLLFIPADDTWHGFQQRPMNTLRRTLIINYVIPTWKSRHELA